MRARRKPVPPGLEGMVAQYIETALWSSTDDNGRPLTAIADTFDEVDLYVRGRVTC